MVNSCVLCLRTEYSITNAGPQLVTAGGEQGVGVEVNRSFSKKEADTLLLSDEGEPTDEQEQVIANTHDRFAKTAAASWQHPRWQWVRKLS